MRRRGRWVLGAALTVCLGIAGFVLVKGRYLEAWLVPFSGDIEAILPDSGFDGQSLEANLRVSPALRKHIHRFQTRMLLRFVATGHGRPVIARSSDRHALDRTWIDLEPRGPGESIPVAEVLSALRGRGWRIVGTVVPRSALVALPPRDIIRPSPVQGERTEFAIYNVSDLLERIELDDPATDTPSRISLGVLRTLIEETTGGSDAWSEPSLMETDEGVGAILVNAPRELHAEVQKVLENLRRPD